MMYKKIYYAEFKDLNENTIKFEIHKNTNSNITASELILDSDAITIDYQGDDDVFYPLKCSGCRISILTKNLLTDLYSGKANEIYCKVYRNNTLFWFGFITPNIYNSDYVDEYNKLDLEFIDVISNLDNYNYTYINDTQAVSSFYDIIMHMLNKVDTTQIIKSIYVQNTKRINGGSDLLNNLHINERNFYDEDEDNEKCKDVLEYMASYLSMTLLQFEDGLYFIDYEAFKSNNHGKFIKYSRTNTATTSVTLPINTININENVYQANASISLNDIYNKIIVIGNNNPIDNLIPKLIDDDDLINQNADANKYYITQETIEKEEYTLLTAFFKSKNNWEWKQPQKLEQSGFVDIEEVTMDNVNNLYRSAYWQRVDDYKKSDGEPSSLNWKGYFTTTTNESFMMISKPYDDRFLSLKNTNYMIFKGGYFILNLTYKMSKHPLAHECKKTSDDKFFSNKYNDGFDHTWFPCKLIIGNYFYDGERFVHYDEYNLKIQRGYYKDVSDRVHYAGSKWYSHIDTYGYQRFITLAEYNALSSSFAKTSGDCVANKMHYFTNNSGVKVFTTEEYYYECLLKDRFFLLHKNKEDDRIFDENKQLTNTVSYKMNLVDSEDGVAINLPNDIILNGTMKFELYGSNHLGIRPCEATSGASEYCNAIHFSDLTLKYTTDKYSIDLFSGKKYELDSKYENEIDTDNVTEFDDVELRINTYNPHASSYSYTIFKSGNGYDYVNKLLNNNTNKSAISEEHIIDKYHSYYSHPRFIYNNSIRKADRITPLTRFYENTLNKNFMGNSLTYNLSSNSVDVSCNEE